MPTYYQDISEQAPEYTWDIRGFSATRTFKIDGLNSTGSPKSGSQAVVYAMLQAQNDGIVPNRGDPHPGDSNIQADTITATMITSTQAKITCTYKKLSAVTGEPSYTAIPLPSMGSSVQDGEVIYDNQGKTLNVPYLANTPGIPDVNNSATKTSQAIATIQRPNTVFRFSRREPVPAFDISVGFTGYVNKNPFLGQPANTFLCTRIESNSQDDGLSWIVEYEFQFRLETWAVGAYYTDDNGQIPKETPPTIGPTWSGTPGVGTPAQGNGFNVFNIYPQADFGLLNLEKPPGAASGR